MARTAITINDVTRAGITNVNTSADMVDGNYLDTPERCVLQAFNNSGSPVTVAVQYNGTFDGQAVSARTITIPPVSWVAIGNLLPSAHYQDADAGRLYVNASSALTVFCAVRFPVGLS